MHRFLLYPGLLLCVLGGYVILMNAASVVVNTRNRRRGIDRFISMVPLVGPLLACAGLFLASAPLWGLAVPWVLDIATWSLLAALPTLVREMRQHRK
ncbi:hypothetical protein [Polyangium mundeleinium]|uniref:Uncharacterized protein n=1 Tax=Polyangium mundeleinium TaxID=2995306 RepID=A0ABT5EPP2_9BACT|nr:hypothetical protein [Polyangium mundeleinium]MDC0743721.1 hypothetical protein [Polyangium mundeleinium]